MNVELLVTGDEILRGAISDTNSAWLLQRIVPLGATVRRITAVGDVKEDLRSALMEGASRADVLIVSGGLGPTSDDLTAEVAAEVAGVPLTRDEVTMARIQARWSRRNKPMPPSVEKQALVPEGSEVLANDEGTAPGFRLRIAQAECFFFAGVPREFQHLCDKHLLPYLKTLSDRAIVTRTLRCIGIPESELDLALLPLAIEHRVKLGLRAAYPETWASFTAEAPVAAVAAATLSPVVAEALRRVEPHGYTTEDESLAEVVGRLLLRANWTVSVAESCTGGMLGEAITQVAGSSRYFVGGALTYANEEKTRALGVSQDMLAAHGAVSEAVACAMAEGIRERTGSTCALAITGVAGPGGGTAEKPVGTVWLALATPNSTTAELHRFTRPDRDSIRAASVASALDLLRRELLKATA